MSYIVQHDGSAWRSPMAKRGSTTGVWATVDSSQHFRHRLVNHGTPRQTPYITELLVTELTGIPTVVRTGLSGRYTVPCVYGALAAGPSQVAICDQRQQPHVALSESLTRVKMTQR